MIQVTSGLFMRDRISIYDIIRVFELYDKAVQFEKQAFSIRKKSRLKFLSLMSKSKEHLGQIIKILTDCKKVKWYYYRFMNDIFVYSGLLGKTQARETDKEKNLSMIKKSVSWVAARLYKTPHQVEKDCTPEELNMLSQEIVKRDLEKMVSAIKAHHIPKDALKEAKSRFTQLEYYHVETTDEHLHEVINPVKMFDKQFMEPH